MQFAERVFKDMLALDMDGEILSADSCVGTFELRAEVTTLDVKVQNSSVIDEDSKRTIGQMSRRLA